MKRLLKHLSLIFFIVCLHISQVNATDPLYSRYQNILSNLELTDKVNAFIKEDNYLSDRLLKKWLHYLASKEQWQIYANHYQTTQNITRQCYYLHALYKIGNKETAFKKVLPLWLKAKEQPKACQFIFNQWLASSEFNSKFLWERIELSLTEQHYSFAKKLSLHLPTPDKALVKLWSQLIKNPLKIKNQVFPKHPYTTRIIVSTIKKLVTQNLSTASKYWKSNINNYPFTLKDEQEIYQKIALYSAISNQPNAEYYFSKLHPETTPDLYHEWRLRAALKIHRWLDVNAIIRTMPPHLQRKSCWQYWYARSFEKLGKKEKADALYALLSDKRNYYGFLASYRAGYPLSMAQEIYSDRPELLIPHKKQITHINSLFTNKEYDKANLLSYELSNDLSKAAQYQLAKHYSTWEWHDKALMLTNASNYHNDLFLRFPLGHYQLVEKYSKKYAVEEPYVYAIIRQESTFRKQVKSSAGALGLMQVIPSTARKISKIYKISLNNMEKMYQPKTNIQVGVAYLSLLSKKFKAHPVLIAAAYNAGPSQVNKWLKNTNKEDADLWIECLPWHETRNYLKNILSFYAVYQYRLSNKPSIETFMEKI